MNWEEAENYLKVCVEAYQEIGFTGSFALSFILPLRERLENGERTQALYDEIMGIAL